jgi:predicted aldo/keto reductase-like oxidoreductase
MGLYYNQYMDFKEQRILGSTGLKAGRLGIGSSYGVSTFSIEKAFDLGCNYFSWGTVTKGKRNNMRHAIRNITSAGRRDDLIVSVFSYSHIAWLMENLFWRTLKQGNLEYADVLLLGYYNKRPPERILKAALRMKEKGMVRFIGLSGHNRKLFSELAELGIFDLFHIRYNAAHRGAEVETFPFLKGDDKPGVVSFTATRWGELMNQKKMPEGQKALTAADCYRFVLTNPDVDLCMTGAKNSAQMNEALSVLNMAPMDEIELERMRVIGDHVRLKGKKF